MNQLSTPSAEENDLIFCKKKYDNLFVIDIEVTSLFYGLEV